MTQIPRRFKTVSRKYPGYKHYEWTLLKLLEDMGSASSRRWLVQCSCGEFARRFENEINYRFIACLSCRTKAPPHE